jgi:hypothetical protein
MIECPFCGNKFDPEQSKQGCVGCSLSKNCGKIKCPNCNFELVKDIQFTLFKKLFEKVKLLWKNL